MSLEIALSENTAAMLKLTAVLESSNMARAEVLAKIEALPGAEIKKTRATKPAAEAAVETKAEAPVEVKPKGPPTVAELQTAFGDYMNVTDPAAREERKTFVKAVCAELGAARVGEIAENQRATALDYIERKVAGEDVKFAAEEEPEDDLL